MVLLLNLVCIAVIVLLLWGTSLMRRDASIVDVFWGAGFVVIVWVSAWANANPAPKVWLLAAMVTIWGARLAGYLAWRNSNQPEDYRYKAMRVRHGVNFPIVSLFTVFGLQGLLMWIISLPIQVGASRAGGWHPGVPIGLVLWACGLFFEAVGDFQLARFKADPANRGLVMNRGLWRYTRHPNYFGDFLVWWGLYGFAAESTSWWWTIIGPLLMSFLLIRVSGVRLLESALKSRVVGYQEYANSTSPFFPLPPKQIQPPD